MRFSIASIPALLLLVNKDAESNNVLPGARSTDVFMLRRQGGVVLAGLDLRQSIREHRIRSFRKYAKKRTLKSTA